VTAGTGCSLILTVPKLAACWLVNPVSGYFYRGMVVLGRAPENRGHRRRATLPLHRDKTSSFELVKAPHAGETIHAIEIPDRWPKFHCAGLIKPIEIANQ
jgi:hypothetical protein